MSNRPRRRRRAADRGQGRRRSHRPTRAARARPEDRSRHYPSSYYGGYGYSPSSYAYPGYSYGYDPSSYYAPASYGYYPYRRAYYRRAYYRPGPWCTDQGCGRSYPNPVLVQVMR